MLTISSSNFFTAAAFFFITPIVDVTFTTFSESILPNAVRAYSRKYGHARDFSEKPQKRAKKGKIFEHLSQNVQNLKIF